MLTFGSSITAGGPPAQPLQLAVGSTYELRWPLIRWLDDGFLADPRQSYTVGFQMLEATIAELGDSWAAGGWEANSPGGNIGGPYAALVTVGAGEPDEVNPAAAGTYLIYGQFTSSGLSAVFLAGAAVLADV